ncbi:MBL fold metallo-hydrolase [Massilia sp. PAMC28688]|uniref:MBL fold metallo-hydrolase n=1 Tax=Massilia sp. PAMC28688 TaxID=2861283 RepID=UPI001C62E436|nr:MBL fold metallo-hydrolase [Massilia sp. PAMC28688]QYF95143.1 MBL fold metallo-hydrolase [Massilia sp. PAMC28688]
MRVFERGWLSSNNVLFTGPGPAVLIDSGYVTHSAQTLALVEHALGGAALAGIVNTHLHSDHCGGNAALQARHGCSIAIPAAEADKVRQWDEDALSYKATGQQCPRFVFDSVVWPGNRLALGGLAWQALGAPGHDPHSLIFYCEREGLLISADALWEHGFGVIFPELDGESGFEEAAATLDLIAQLDVRLVIPGHGAPFEDVGSALARARSRLDYLQAGPARNAENAVKVILKFLLLERQRIALAALPALLSAIPVMEGARRRYLRQAPEELAQWAVAALLRAGAARVEGGMLVNHEG